LPDTPLDAPELYFNRELSTLDFHQRVLHQALDERIPLLERVFFCAITGSNLDEFFRKRVGGLKRQQAAGVSSLSPDGRTPTEQLALVRTAALRLYDALAHCWEDTLRPLLRTELDVHVRDYDTLTNPERAHVDAHFEEHVFPVLTPLAVDPGHPFPFLSNLSLSLAVSLHHAGTGEDRFARLKVPDNQPRWVKLPTSHHYVPLEQVIAHNADALFKGMLVQSVHAFRVTRNADIRRDEEEANDLLKLISEELRERRFAPVVRLEVQTDMPKDVRSFLAQELSLSDDALYTAPSLLGHTDLMALSGIDMPEHHYPKWTPVTPSRLRTSEQGPSLLHDTNTPPPDDLFGVIREADVLVHHPYESFDTSVQRFVEEAADDPNVLAIKQTLYRTSDDSPIVASLVRAAEQGKQVAVLVEVKARFDEANNIEWGRTLEESGVHVAYGLVGLKTHTKVTLVVREEGEALRLYCHIGTGNYNAKTARAYTDLGLFTCDPAVSEDVMNLFHYLTGYAPEQSYNELLVAPHTMRRRFETLIDQEIAHQQEHGTGRIVAKMNALNDSDMISKLYEASQAGVSIDLIVRGHCRLRSGLEGISENIRVLSILDRFLEHTRIYYFANNGAPRVFMGSADWMTRNLNRRVEAIVEVHDDALRERIIRILDYACHDQYAAWELHEDGRYVQRTPPPDTPREASALQWRLMHDAMQRTPSDAQPNG
jgi:polyphosphate kinase